MRVGLIIYGSINTVSGGYLYDRQLVDHLRQRGDTVDLISLPWRNYGQHLTHNVQRRYFDQIVRGGFDVLVQDELNHPSLFLLNRRLRPHLNGPIVSLVHHLRSSELRPHWQNGLYRWVERHYLNSADAFIYNSYSTKKHVEQLLNEPKPHVVAYPGGNRLHAATQSAHSPGQPLRAIFVGNVTPRKGLHTLLNALHQLPTDMWRLDIVGRLDADPRYVATHRSALDHPNITLHGYCPDAELARLMARSHVLAVPSSFEGFGIVYLEAMGFGLPTIGTSSGAAHELIAHGENGFLIPPDDAEALAKHLQTLHNQPQLRQQMSQRARQRFLAHPTWTASMATVRDFLETMVNCWQRNPKQRA